MSGPLRSSVRSTDNNASAADDDDRSTHSRSSVRSSVSRSSTVGRTSGTASGTGGGGLPRSRPRPSSMVRHGGAAPRAHLELMLHARGLKNLGRRGHVSDPYARVSVMDESGREVRDIVGKTEVAFNALNPVWCDPVSIDYAPSSKMLIEITVYDYSKTKEHKEMGRAQFEIGEIVRSKTRMKAKRLQNSQGRQQSGALAGGWVFVHGETAPDEAHSRFVTLELHGVSLKNVEGVLSKSDPFYEVSKKTENGDWRAVYRSEHIDDDLDPQWKPGEINLHRLCYGHKEKPVLIQVFDYEKNGKHRPLGQVETTVNGLVDASSFDTRSKPLELTLDGKSGYGSLKVKGCYFTGSTAAMPAYVNSKPARRSSSIGGRRPNPVQRSNRDDPVGLGDALDTSHHSLASRRQSQTSQHSKVDTTNQGKQNSVEPPPEFSFKPVAVPPEYANEEKSSAPPSPLHSSPLYDQHIPPKSHSDALEEARVARRKKKSAREHGFSGVLLQFVTAAGLEDEELSPEDDDVLIGREATGVISSSIKDALGSSRNLMAGSSRNLMDGANDAVRESVKGHRRGMILRAASAKFSGMFG